MSITESIMENLIREVMAEASIIKDKKSSSEIAVSLDISRSYGDNIAYFKFRPDRNISWEHCSRISFRYPEYIDHNGKSYRLTRDEKKKLIRLLNSPSDKDKNLTSWLCAIVEFNKLVKNIDDGKYILPMDLEMPNYMKLK